MFADNGRALSFGQLYGTLNRLERDGQIQVFGAEPGVGPDRKRYVIAETGVAQVEKVVLALLSDRPAATYLDLQRDAHLARLRELTAMHKSGPLPRTLLADYGLLHLEADLRWIDTTVARLDQLRSELGR